MLQTLYNLIYDILVDIYMFKPTNNKLRIVILYMTILNLIRTGYTHILATKTTLSSILNISRIFGYALVLSIVSDQDCMTDPTKSYVKDWRRNITLLIFLVSSVTNGIQIIKKIKNHRATHNTQYNTL